MFGVYKFWFGFVGSGMEVPGGSVPVGTFRILLETGDMLLEENGNFLRKEQSS